MATLLQCPECGSALVDTDEGGPLCLRCFIDGGIGEETGAHARDTPLVGRKFGRFHVIRKIGEGGMGEVYLAEDEKLERKVALKFLSEAAQRDSANRTRFDREAKAAAALDHPFIGKIYDTGEADGEAYIAMEYVEGETLQERLAHGPLPISDAVAIATEVAEALSAAHERGIVHRDLKPSNIILTTGGHIKVMDLGLAKRLAAPEDLLTRGSESNPLTEQLTVVGTLPYMSPEQARGEEVDARSDIFSLGAVLYEIVTGKRAFEGRTPATNFDQILNHVPVPPVSLNPEVPEALEAVIAKALQKERDHRYQSARDLWDDLRRLSAGAQRGELAAATGQGSKMWGAGTRNRHAAIVSLFIVALAAVAALWWRGGESVEEERSGASGTTPALESEAALQTAELDPLRIAILPLMNLSAESEENVMFVGGLHSDIITRISRIRSLKVISQTSVLEYENTPRNVREIAAELGVGTILEGGVRRAGDRLRINVQLIDARDDRQIWGEIFDRFFSMNAIFDIQSEIAERITEALAVEFRPEERAEVATRPTENKEAYDFYLRGRYYEGRTDLYRWDRYSLSGPLYEKAIELDRRFALAHARLSIALISQASHGRISGEEGSRRALNAAQRALEIQPGVAEGHLALGAYHVVFTGDWEQVLKELKIAEAGMPGNWEVFIWRSHALDQLGRIEEGVTEAERALVTAPRNPEAYFILLLYYRRVRRYEDAIQAGLKGLELAPDYVHQFAHVVSLPMQFDGDTKRARELFDKFPHLHGEHRARSKLFWIEFRERNYSEALEALSEIHEENVFGLGKVLKVNLMKGLTHIMSGDEVEAKAHLQLAVAEIEEKIAEASERLANAESANDERSIEGRRKRLAHWHMALGLAYAGLGLREEAIREGNLCVSQPESHPFDTRLLFSWIYGLLDDAKGAIEQIEYVVPESYNFGFGGATNYPFFDGIRNEPAWKAFEARHHG